MNEALIDPSSAIILVSEFISIKAKAKKIGTNKSKYGDILKKDRFIMGMLLFCPILHDTNKQ